MSPGLPRSGEWERQPSPMCMRGSSTGCVAPGKRWPVGAPGSPVRARESEDLPLVHAPPVRADGEFD